MRERPILFRGEMVRAILAGRKCMTRRAVNKDISNQFDIDVDNTVAAYINQLTGDSCNPVEICPYGTVGDRLWVRETWKLVPETAYRLSDGVWQTINPSDPHEAAIYKCGWERSPGGVSWKPSIFMPRWASRITLEITDVKVEQLQDITEEDAEKEGMPNEYPIEPVYCPVCHGGGTFGTNDRRTLGHIDIDCPYCDTASKKFKNLWGSINGKKQGKTWGDNPWVWVVEFRRVENV